MALNDRTHGIDTILSATQLSTAMTPLMIRAWTSTASGKIFVLFWLEKQLLCCWNSQIRERTLLLLTAASRQNRLESI